MTAYPAQYRTVVILQPGYLPWLGFFDQMRAADVFVYYDDVQFDKHGWRNRNRIKDAAGQPHWLTVPVRHSSLNLPRIIDVEVDPRAPWARKHIGTLRQFYSRAPFLKQYLPELEDLLNRDWQRLVDLDLAVVALMCRWLKIERRIERSSELKIDGTQSGRLLNICKHLGATRYLSGAAARDYLDVGLFDPQGIQVSWQNFVHPEYPQLHGAFVPYLSALDLLLNCGDESAAVLTGVSAGSAAA